MKITLNQLVSLFHELNGQKKNDVIILQGFLLQKMNAKIKLYVNRLNKIVTDEINLLEKTQKELFEKYAVEQDGELILIGDGLNKFNEEFDELMKTQIDIDVLLLWSSQLTADDLSNIETDEYYPVLYELIDNKN